MAFVIHHVNHDRVLTKEFSEDELLAYTSAFDKRRIEEGCKYDYAVIDTSSGDVVGYLRHLH